MPGCLQDAAFASLCCLSCLVRNSFLQLAYSHVHGDDIDIAVIASSSRCHEAARGHKAELQTVLGKRSGTCMNAWTLTLSHHVELMVKCQLEARLACYSSTQTGDTPTMTYTQTHTHTDNKIKIYSYIYKNNFGAEPEAITLQNFGPSVGNSVWSSNTMSGFMPTLFMSVPAGV